MAAIMMMPAIEALDLNIKGRAARTDFIQICSNEWVRNRFGHAHPIP